MDAPLPTQSAGDCLQAGLEDWELSRIRVNLLQRADAHDLLERLSLLSPLPGQSQNIKGKFEKMFSPRAARTIPSIQRHAVSLLTALTSYYECTR